MSVNNTSDRRASEAEDREVWASAGSFPAAPTEAIMSNTAN